MLHHIASATIQVAQTKVNYKCHQEDGNNPYAATIFFVLKESSDFYVCCYIENTRCVPFDIKFTR